MEQGEPLAALRHFLDREGRLLRWPARHKMKQVALDYLVTRLTPDRYYTERELSVALLDLMHPDFSDVATVRRALVDARLVEREPDGSRYWLRSRPAADA